MLCLFVACSSPTDPDRAVEQPGAHAVGTRRITTTDATRSYTFQAWYPTTSPTADVAIEALEAEPLRSRTTALLAGVATCPTRRLTVAVDGDPEAGSFPLVVASHCHACTRFSNASTAIRLASHGYVVASCDHEGGTLYDVVRGQLASPTEGIDDRPLDVRYLANRLSRLPTSDPLAGLIDLDRFGVAGHSFGALTAMRVTVIDPRVKAIVPQAPTSADLAFVGYVDPPPPHVPIMLQGAKADRTLDYTQNVLNAWAWATSPKYLLSIETGGHFTFSDLCQFDLGALSERVKLDIPGADVKKVLEDGCGPMAPKAAVALPLIAHFAVGFFNARLLGSTGSAALLTQAKADTFGAGVAELQAAP